MYSGDPTSAGKFSLLPDILLHSGSEMASGQGTVGIQGIPAPNAKYKTDPSNNIPCVTDMPLRYEITEFFERMLKSNDSVMQMQWTLFIKGLERFKGKPVEERLSYFQVAGIHGYPEQSWDGAPPPPSDPLPSPPQPPGKNPFGGYCHHNTIAFPTWHRPYMLLYEQCIWQNMKDTITEWIEQGTLKDVQADPWRKAADSWRLFYWDWARKQKYPNNANPDVQAWDDFGIPYLFSLGEVTIFPPGERALKYPNPLWNFVNPEKDKTTNQPLPFGQMPAGKTQWNIHNDPQHPTPKDTILPWSQCTSTSRWGILQDFNTKAYSGLNGKNEWQCCNTALATAGSRFYKPRRGYKKDHKSMSDNEWAKVKPGTLADAVNRMFSVDYNGTWTSFASTKWYAEEELNIRTGFMSLEFIHNNIHNITGGSSLGYNPNDKDDQPDPQGIYGLGHMSDVPVAAFDPIFWMHHCNIDRYTAMWQCLNWDKWFEPEPAPASDIRENVPDIKSDEALQPFHVHDGGDPNDVNNMWTSDRGRDWTKSGYQYDDLMPSSQAVNADGKLIPEIYKEDLQVYIHKTYPGTSYQAWAIREDLTIENKAFFGPTTTEQKAFEDYLVNVVYDRYALDGRSYGIEFYLGDDYIGQIYSLGGMKPGTETGCANCGNQKNARVLSKAQLPISIALMRKAADQSFEALNTFMKDDVESYLAKNLNLKYFEAGGATRDPSDFPNTKISVLGGKAIWSQSERDGEDIWRPPFYVTETYRPLYGATENLPGGAKADTTGGPASSDAPEKSLDEIDVPTAAPAA